MANEIILEKLANGVRYLLIPLPGVNSVATAVMAGVGSRYETPEINGISHFLEHMVFKGTKKYPTTDDVNFIERLGGLQNAYTDLDITSYHNKVLSTDCLQALELNKELALSPLLEQKHIDKERDVIIEEMKRYEDEPEAKVEETFHSLLYPGTKLGMRIIGEEVSLRSVASRELQKYHDYWYAPDKIVVILAGNLNNVTMQQCSNVVSKWFSGLKFRATTDIEIVKPNQTKPQLAVVTKPDAQQAHLVLGVRAFARGSEDRFAWSLFNLIMGVSFTSRLFKEIREKRGLCYHVRSSGSSYVDVGSWEIYAGVATNKVTQAIQAIQAELVKVKEKGITQDELKVAKKRLATLLAFKSEDPDFLADYYGRQIVYDLPLLTISDYVKKTQSVTVAEVNKLTRKYLLTQTLNLALVWNKPKDEKLLDVLKI